jgi:hypothetical protein
MTRVSEIAEHWLGLCRKPPVFRASQADIVNLPESAYEGSPDGGAGGSGTIRRGIGAALSGTKTLIHNRQLFWFTLLAGLVLVGNTLGLSVLPYIRKIMQTGIIGGLVLEFVIEFATLFCLVFLLAGLALSTSSEKEGSASFFAELAGAKKFQKAIFLWSFILALAGMLLFSIYNYSFVWSPPLWFNIVAPLEFFLFDTLSQFPFNLTPYPPTAIFTELPGYGRSLLLGVYPGLMGALIFSAINLLLLVLTPFVVPFIVLEQKTLRVAVMGSFAMMKKIWIEVAACAVFLGVVVYGVFLTYLLVQAAHGIVSPSEVVFYPPSDMGIAALGLLYDLALFCIAFVVATVGGIAALDLYISAKTRESA